MSLQQDDQKMKDEKNITEDKAIKMDNKDEFSYLNNTLDDKFDNSEKDDTNNDRTFSENGNKNTNNENFDLRVVRGAALMRYNILPARRRCLQKHNPLTRDQRNTTNLISKMNKITDISIKTDDSEPIGANKLYLSLLNSLLPYAFLLICFFICI